MKNRIVKFSIFLTLMLVLFNGQILCCAASNGNPEDISSRTLEIMLTYMDESELTPVQGAKVQVSQVAELVKVKGNYQYQLTDEYRSSDLEINSMKNASESIKVAEILNDMKIKHQLPYQSGVTDSQGKASFSFSEPGIYLVSQSGWTTQDVQYTEFAPYLVKLPLPDSDDQVQITSWDNHVVTKPKIGIEKIPQKTETPPKQSTPSKQPTPPVKTGDDTNIYLYLGLMAVSVFLFIVIWNRKKKENR